MNDTMFIDRNGNVSSQNPKIEPPTATAQEQESHYRPIDHLLNEPYFAHIVYKDSDMLYIGKNIIPGKVVDWADKLASLYYQYSIYIGNTDVDLRIVREVIIKNRAYVGYRDLYNRTIKNTSKDTDKHKSSSSHDNTDSLINAALADEWLAKVISANRNDKHIHDIVETIQANQYKIITEDLLKNMLIHGCAGSGKTMVMLHRIRFLKYNNPNLKMSDFVIISPTDILGKENTELSNILQINQVNQFSTRAFYGYLSKLYMDRNGIDYSDFVVEDGNVYKKDYLQSTIDNMSFALLELLDYKCNTGKKFLDKEKEEIIKNITFYKKKLTESEEEFESDYKAYLMSLNEIKSISQYDLEAICDFLSKEIKQESHLKAQKYIYEMLKSSKCFGKKRSGKSLTNLDNFIENLDVKGIYQTNFDIQNSVQAVQLFSLYYDGDLSDEVLKTVLNEINNASLDIVDFHLNVINEHLEKITSYRIYKGYFANLLLKQNEYLSSVKVKHELKKGKELEIFSDTIKFYSLINDKDEVKNTPYSYFKEYSDMDAKYKRVEDQINGTKQYAYLFDAFCSMINCGKNENKYVIPTEKCYALSKILYELFGAIDDSCKYIYVDEFQDFSIEELQFIKNVFNTSTYNLYGDVRQCINVKGINSLSEASGLCDDNLFSLNVNYRNSHDVAEYVRKLFNIDMHSIGLPGKVKVNANLKDLVYDETDRIVVIVNSEINITDYIKKCYGDEAYLYSETGEIIRGKVNIIDIKMVKGLEFEKVVVINEGLTENEKYVAYTRALEDLYII